MCSIVDKQTLSATMSIVEPIIGTQWDVWQMSNSLYNLHDLLTTHPTFNRQTVGLRMKRRRYKRFLIRITYNDPL